MINIVFKNLDSSQLARDVANDRINGIIEKFPELEKSRISVTLEMKNSPLHAGPDLFTVKAHINGRKYQNIRVEKSAPNLYIALADVVEHLLERLNRFGDKARVKSRNTARKVLQSSRNAQ